MTNRRFVNNLQKIAEEFEKLCAELLQQSGYQTEVDVPIQTGVGRHRVDHRRELG